VSALSVVVGMAFAVSWTALRDVAMAIGIPTVAATLYPFVVDGLMALALVATLTLTGDARRTALRVLAAYTAASLTLNYVHGLVPELHGLEPGERVRLAATDVAHWALVGLAAALPVGAIYFGSDLVARVLHHRPEQSVSTLEPSTPTAAPEPAPVGPDPEPEQPEQSTPTTAPTGAPESTPTARSSRPRPTQPTTPRRKTGPVPAAARQSTPPRRTLEELLTDARELSLEEQESAERLRTTLRVGASRARELRDRLAVERQERPALTAAPDPEPEDLEEQGQTGSAPATWESESRAAVEWVFNGGDEPMPTRTVDAAGKPLEGVAW
jgi:hypothetical protein